MSVNPWTYDMNKYTIYNFIDQKYKLFSINVNKLTIKNEIHKNNIKFPVIIKPILCSGQGKGVQLLKSFDDINLYFKNINQYDEFILQEYYFPKYEVGLLYEKIPFSSGKIVSIVMKVKNSNTWKPMLCQNVYNNEETSCTDMTNITNNKLLNVINEISNQIPNFYVGRYDIGFNDIDDFKNGKNFKIFEVNGVMGFDLNYLFTNNDENKINKFFLLIRWILIRLLIGFINVATLNFHPFEIIFGANKRYNAYIKCKDWEHLVSPSPA